MVIAQAEDARAAFRQRQHRRPDRPPLGDGFRAGRRRVAELGQPLGRVPDTRRRATASKVSRGHGSAPVGRLPGGATACRRRRASVAAVIELALVGRAGLQQAREEIVSEILQDGEAVLRIAGRAPPAPRALPAQPVRHGDEGFDPAGGEAGHRVPAQRRPFFRSGFGRADRALQRGGLVHEDEAAAGRIAQSLVGAGGGVAGQALPGGVAEPCAVEKVAAQRLAVRAQAGDPSRRRMGRAGPAARHPARSAPASRPARSGGRSPSSRSGHSITAAPVSSASSRPSSCASAAERRR